MPLPKIMGAAAAEVMKVNDGNDSLDMFIRQAIGKEPFLSFSRANDSPVQWIQLLHALDQQDLPGWPLLSPLKIQMQKCDKCSREYCSTINYRRHIRLHRRNLNLDKDSTTKNRGLLLAFWDKLSLEEAMEIMSFNDVSLEGVNGTSIVKALTSFIRRPGFTSLPQSYVSSGSALLDIIQGRPSRFPISSQELFSILDDASEGTFLLAGTAESLQKFVFDGEAGKIGLEMRNLVACTSFLIEQKLVKACLADKDAEALRYHNLLVEEEEAAQKRHAAILEKKKQKKLRQKEHKTKGQANAERYDSPEDTSPSRTSSPGDADSVLEVPEVLQNPTRPEPVQIMDVEDYNDKRHGDGDSGLGTSQIVYLDFISYQNVGHRALRRSGRRSVVNSHRQAPKLHRTSNGFHTNHNNHAQKFGNMKKHASSRESRTAAANGVKVWTPKPKSDTDDESYKTRMQIEPVNLPDQDKKHEVLIGSISVKLGNCSNPQHDENFGRSQESSALEIHEMAVKTEAMQSSANRSTVMQWKPVSRYDNGGRVPVQVGGGECKVGSIPCNGSNEVQQTTELETRSNHREKSPTSMENEAHKSLKFSSHMAEAFLAKRWKEAVASDHVKLVLYPEARPSPGCHGNNQEAVPYFTLGKRGILQSAENCLESYKTLEHSVAAKSKTRANKPDKGSKVKYIPKQGSGWKEAVASDHVKLVLYPEARPSPGCHGNNQEAVPYFTLGKRGILQSAENCLESYKTLEHSVAAKSKTRANKPDKGSKVKYIPKQGSG